MLKFARSPALHQTPYAHCHRVNNRVARVHDSSATAAQQQRIDAHRPRGLARCLPRAAKPERPARSKTMNPCILLATSAHALMPFASPSSWKVHNLGGPRVLKGDNGTVARADATARRRVASRVARE